MPSDLSRNQLCEVYGFVMALALTLLHCVASLILPNTNPSCKSMVLPRFRTSLNAESTKAASAAFISAMHLMKSLRAWKWRRGARDS